MTMPENAVNVMQVQQQIRANASELQDYFSDLYKWESSINKMDEAKKKAPKPRPSNLPRIRDGAQVTTQSTKVVEERLTHKDTQQTADAHTYDKGYKKWEKFDVDAVLRDMDNDSCPTNRDQEPLESTSSSGSTTAPSTTQKIVVEAPRKEKNDIGKSREQIEREDGNEHYKNGDYVAAIKCYTRCLGYNAQNAVVLSNRAMAFLKNREYSKAEDDCTLALKIDPSHVKSYSRRGTARNSLGKHRLALLDFEKAAELDPNSKQIDNQIVYTRDLIKSAIKRAPKRSDIKIQVVESSTNDSKKNISTEPIEPIEVIEDKENFAGNATLKTRGILTKTPIIKPILKTPQKTPAPPPAPLGATSKEPESTTAIHKAASTTSSSTSLPNLPKKAPTSSYEFGRVWKTLSLKGDVQRKKELLELQGEFIRKISPKSLPSVFKNSIESDLLCELFHAIRHCLYASDKSFVFDFVGGLTKVPRFSMTISFLTKKEKEDIEWVFNELTKDKGAKEVEDVKKLYQV